MILVNMDWRLILDTKINLTGAVLTIEYIKPAATVAVSAAALISGTTKAYIDIAAATNDTAGKWLFRVKAVIAGFVYYSEPVHVDVRPAWFPWPGV